MKLILRTNFENTPVIREINHYPVFNDGYIYYVPIGSKEQKCMQLQYITEITIIL